MHIQIHLQRVLIRLHLKMAIIIGNFKNYVFWIRVEIYVKYQYTGVVLWIVRYNGVMNANTDTLVFVILIVIFRIIISIHWLTYGVDSMVPGGCRDICNIEKHI